MTAGIADPALHCLAGELVLRESDALDRKAWDEWLALYQEDVVYWVPAWLDEYRTTTDPDAEISLIYHLSRRELEERVRRVQSRKSITALPLPRTLHLIGGVRIVDVQPDSLEVRSNGAVHVYDARTASHHITAIRYTHRFNRHADGAWLIAAKTMVMINDRMPSVVDFYTL